MMKVLELAVSYDQTYKFRTALTSLLSVLTIRLTGCKFIMLAVNGFVAFLDRGAHVFAVLLERGPG